MHEYGSGAFAVQDGTVYFSNFADQRLYRQDVGQSPRALTPAAAAGALAPLGARAQTGDWPNKPVRFICGYAAGGLTDIARIAALLADGCRRRGYALEPIAGRDVVHVVGGDRFSAAIAAASIVAKVTRDRLMGRLAVCHPGYGFESHAGYGTKDHERAIARLGLCDQHRRSIKKLAQLAAAGESDGER